MRCIKGSPRNNENYTELIIIALCTNNDVVFLTFFISREWPPAVGFTQDWWVPQWVELWNWKQICSHQGCSWVKGWNGWDGKNFVLKMLMDYEKVEKRARELSGRNAKINMLLRRAHHQWTNFRCWCGWCVTEGMSAWQKVGRKEYRVVTSLPPTPTLLPLCLWPQAVHLFSPNLNFLYHKLGVETTSHQVVGRMSETWYAELRWVWLNKH